MPIELREKPKPTPKCPSELRELIPYRVVEVRESDCGVAVGDIVLRFPAHGHGCYLLNVTQAKMLWDKGYHHDSWSKRFMCLRAHQVETIVFSVDHDDRPE